MALLQTASGGSGGYVNTFNFTFGSALTAGSTLVLNLTNGNTDTISSVTDNKSNSWSSPLTSVNATSGNRQSFLYVVTNAVAGSTTVTVNLGTGIFSDTSYIAREYSAITTLDASATANDGSTSTLAHPAGTTGLTIQANELVVVGGGAASSVDPGFTAGAGYGNGVEQKGFDLYTWSFMSDAIISAIGTQVGSFASTQLVQGQGFTATFKAVVATSITGQFFVMF